MTTYYVCLDTNILIDIVQFLEAGKPPRWWETLQKLVKDNQAEIVVPGITLLEMESVIRDLESELGAATTKAVADTKSDTLRGHLAESLKAWRTKTVEGWKAEAKKLEELLRAKPGHVIEFTDSIGHRTRLRLIAGRLPRAPEQDSQQKKWLRDQDCAIVESLVIFFEDKLADSILAFGTNDKRDGGFGQIENGKGSLDKTKFEKGVGVLDSTFEVGLPPSQLFDDMDKLVSFVEKKEHPKTLTAEQQAVVQEMKFEQEATAQVLKPVVSRVEIPIGWLQGMESQQIANANAVAAHHQLLMPGFRLGGVRHGPYLVLDPQPESSGDVQPFFDTMSGLPPSVLDVPVQGIETFHGDLGDEEPKREPEHPPKSETDESPDPPKL